MARQDLDIIEPMDEYERFADEKMDETLHKTP